MAKKLRIYYKIENHKLVITKKDCPKCGLGTYLANHDTRFACGKCGYTEWFKK